MTPEKKDSLNNFISFSTEQKAVLISSGYEIYKLTGKSIFSLREREIGNIFWTKWHNGQKFELRTSINSEVAIMPESLFLPDSDKKTRAQQVLMVREFSEKIGIIIPDARAIIGNVEDYADLIFTFQNKTGQLLLSTNLNNGAVCTTTKVEGFGHLVIGYDIRHGLFIDRVKSDCSSEYVYAAPLILPVRKNEI